jgi:hypothetical protein
MGIRDEIIKTLESNIRYETLQTTEEKQYDKKEHEKEVISELKYHIGNNTYSPLFLNQLTQLHGIHYVEIQGKKHPYDISLIYWTLESIIRKQVPYKTFTRKTSFLFNKNLLHTHHHESFYIERNTINYFKRKYKTDESVIKRLDELQLLYPDHKPHPLLIIETLNESNNRIDKTGQWIIFRQANNAFYFICLALHNSSDKNDKILYEEIKGYI